MIVVRHQSPGVVLLGRGVPLLGTWGLAWHGVRRVMFCGAVLTYLRVVFRIRRALVVLGVRVLDWT